MTRPSGIEPDRDLPGWARVAVALAVGVLLACSALAI